MIGYLGLGSNVGDSYAHLQAARQLVARHPEIEVLASSKLYKTAPYGDVEQADFLNAVVQIDTSLSPEDLLVVTQSAEKALGRVKTVHWGPRVIDLDILLLGEERHQTSQLTIPHAELTLRSFVLIPLADVYTEELLLGKPLAAWIEATGNKTEVELSEKEW